MTGGDSKARGGFPHTRWSLVAQASGGAEDAAASALNDLLRTYCPVLKRHLVRAMSFTPHAADDLVQDFVAHKILRKNILSGANRTRGRFRTYLLTAFTRFAIGEIRRRKARKRAPLGDDALRLDDLPEAALAAADRHRALDLDWARQTLAMAIERMKADCRVKGRRDLWEVFSCRILKPALTT